MKESLRSLFNLFMFLHSLLFVYLQIVYCLRLRQTKELSLCQKLIFSNTYIVSTQFRIPLIFQT